jgi:tetratricopeptide (TPR) repeat protein/V8-like Glu-specific endopeptidase
MHISSLFLTAALVGTNVALIQPVAVAKSASEIRSIAKAVTVEIKLKQNGSIGSGVIISKKGDLYTLVTNRHVVCGKSNCQKVSESEVYSLGLFDGQKYQVRKSAIKLLGSDLDLAIIQFRSSRNYVVAKLATPESLKVGDDIYTAGFPLEQPGFSFDDGEAISVVNKRLTGDSGGYTIIYNALTLPGMSGGGVFNGSGQLVAIHGVGDQYRENTQVENKSQVGSKIGYNRGIPVRWLVQNLAEVGINLGTASSLPGIRAARSQVPTTADEYFIAGFNKFVEPGDDVITGKKQAIQELSRAIRLNPKYQYAYFMRASVYEQVKEFQKSLTDFNQSISINPKYSEAYKNRAILKADKLNDIQGALSDFNQAISINPEYFSAYYNRAILKKNKLNDIRGALTDYNQAISINPKYSKPYNNRAILKTDKLNDIRGALSDFSQAISINPEYSEAYYNRAILKTDKLNDIQGALSDFSQAISINPEYSEAYYNRAILKKNKLNDIQGALTDYNQVISINPKDSNAYINRAILKKNKLNDIRGALSDFSQAISINPKDSNAYYNRAILKTDKLNDIQGALSDFNQAISINLKDSEAYYSRAILKAIKLNDKPGAIQDFRQAAQLYREQGKTEYLKDAINQLKDLGATE